MFDWARSLFRPAAKTAAQPQIRARYENALSTDENGRQWAMVDYLSARSANSFQVRRTLRMRARYEFSNNPYLYGICSSNADDLIGHGPALKCGRNSNAENKQIESAWNEWVDEVGLVSSLRTMKLAKNVDGEGVLVLKTVRDMENSVKLWPCDIESDMLTATMPTDLEELWLDGVEIHKITGQPISYNVMRTHPGDFFFPGMNPLQADRIKAKFVVHWFNKMRPLQVRGIPVFTSALDLCSELRSYRKAVLSKANIAANFTAVLETESAADDGSSTMKPFVNVPIDRGTMTALPANAKFRQYDAGEPGTTYEMFHEKCLGEICRPLNYPVNLALGTSQKFNFSSAKLDHVNYRNSLMVERKDCDRVALEKIFRVWMDEAIMIPGLLPDGINSYRDVPHAWHWPGFAPLDAVADAEADHSRISNGTLTWEQYWASRGMDWRDVMAQQARERQEIETFKLVFGDPLKKSETETETVEETANAD